MAKNTKKGNCSDNGELTTNDAREGVESVRESGTNTNKASETAKRVKKGAVAQNPPRRSDRLQQNLKNHTNRDHHQDKKRFE